jgi:hypothetical protein
MTISRDPADVAEARAQIARGGRRGRRAKYAAVPTIVDGHRFASKREAHRYGELCQLARAGHIRDLQLQPVFPIVLDGRQVSAYRADFQYVNATTGEVFVEDVKGMRTPVYILKKKLIEALYPFEIREVR